MPEAPEAPPLPAPSATPPGMALSPKCWRFTAAAVSMLDDPDARAAWNAWAVSCGLDPDAGPVASLGPAVPFHVAPFAVSGLDAMAARLIRTIEGDGPEPERLDAENDLGLVLAIRDDLARGCGLPVCKGGAGRA